MLFTKCDPWGTTTSNWSTRSLQDVQWLNSCILSSVFLLLVQLLLPAATVQKLQKSDAILIYITISFPVEWLTDGIVCHRMLSIQAVWTASKMPWTRSGKQRWASLRTSRSIRPYWPHLLIAGVAAPGILHSFYKSWIGICMRSIEWLRCRWPWGTSKPQTTPIFAFFITFHIFVLGKCRDVIFGIQADSS